MFKMKFNNHGFLLLVIASLVSAGRAAADCPDTPSGNHIYLGLDSPIIHNRSNDWGGEEPAGEVLELVRAQLVWLPAIKEQRYRDQYVIDMNRENSSVSNVRLWDGELQSYVDDDVFPVDVGGNTDWEKGQIHLITCASTIFSHAPMLMFAYYGSGGLIYPWVTRVTPVFVNMAVSDIVVSGAIAGNFNNSLDERMQTDIEHATGIRPEHYVVQNLMIQNLQPVEDLLRGNPAVFFNPQNVLVRHNRLYVTGAPASVLVPIPISSVQQGETELLGAGNLVGGLESHIGPLTVYRKGSRDSEWWLGNASVIQARPEITVQASECVDGRTRINAFFTYESPLRGEVFLYWADSSGPLERGEAIIDRRVTCDREYRLYGERNGEFGTVRSLDTWLRY